MTVTDSTEAAPLPRARRFLILALKLAVTFAALAFLVTRQPLSELLLAASRISPAAMALAVACQLAALCVGTYRWLLLMRAYGASAELSFSELLKVYFVGYFYNTYLPGAVSGDVLRGIATRRAFASEGATGAVAVVFVERALGLAGVMGLTAISTMLFARGRFDGVLPYSALAIVAVAAAITAIAIGKRSARFASGPLARLLSKLPILVRPGPFVVAALLSIVTHVLVSLCGHALIASIRPETTLGDSLLAMPLAGAAGYFPLTWAGAGARDYALVSLYEALGVPRAAGVATSFGYLFASLFTAGLGGIVQLATPLDTRDTPGPHKPT